MKDSYSQEKGLFYYPYSGMNENRLNTIKQILFYYDEIYLLRAWEGGDSEGLKKTSSFSPSFKDQEYEDIDNLEKEGLICWLDPESNIRQFSSDIVHETIQDIDLFRSYYPDIDSLQSWEIWKPKIANSLERHLPKEYKYLLNLDEPQINVPFSFGEAIILNHAFFACDKLKLVPFTDDSFHHKFYDMKIQRHIANLSLDNEDRIRLDKIKKEIGLDQFSRSVMELLIPIFKDTTSISAEALLELRDNTRESRERFREKISELFEKYMLMKEKPSIKKLVDKMIRPEINKIYSERQKLVLPDRFDTKKTSMKAVGLAIPFIGNAIGYFELHKEAIKEREFSRLASSSLYYVIEINDRFSNFMA